MGTKKAHSSMHSPSEAVNYANPVKKNGFCDGPEGRQNLGKAAKLQTIKEMYQLKQELILFPQRFSLFPTKGSFSPDPSRLFPTLYVPIMSCSLSRSRPAACIAWPGAPIACLVSIY